MVEATDELRTAIFETIANRLGEHPKSQNHEIADSGEYETRLGAFDVEVLAEWIAPALLAVVAEARTEGAIAALEDFDRRKSFGIENWRVHRDITNIVAALRGVGNQNAEVTVDDLALDEMDGNQNAEPRWSANRLEEVLREGLPDQNAEPEDKP